MTYSMTALAAEIIKLTQPSIDRATCFTQHPGLLDAWSYRAHELAQTMLASGPPYRESAARTVVGFAFGRGEAPAAFWGTDLGRFLFERGGFPPRNPSKTETAWILGISHQAVSDLIRRNRLPAVEGRVDKDAVLKRLLPRFEER